VVDMLTLVEEALYVFLVRSTQMKGAIPSTLLQLDIRMSMLAVYGNANLLY
jgi:hypothetical protein